MALRDPVTIERLVEALGGAAINIYVRSGSPRAEQLKRPGVARVGTASRVALMALAATRRIAGEAVR